MSDFKYNLLYLLKPAPEGITKTEIDELNKDRPEEEQWSACSAAVFLSLLFPPDGSYSWLMLPVDGRPEAKEKQFELDDLEVFKAWAMLAHRLSMSETLHESKKELAQTVHQVILESMRRTAEKGPPS